VQVRPAAGYAERTYGAQDGLRLHYREYGDPLAPGTPLLCLTGLTRNAHDYHDLATRLAAHRRVICPDYRGRGRSSHDPDWRNYQPRTYVGDILQLLIAANLHRVVVVGTSLGGLLTMGLAVAQPSCLAGVVLNDVGPDIDNTGLDRIRGYIGRDHPQPDWPAAVRFVKETFRTSGAKSEADWLQVAEGTFRQGADGLLHVDWDVALARPLERAGPIPDLWPLFRALRRTPVLAFRGALSDLLTAATFDRMQREHPALRRVTVAGVGHVPTLAEPEARDAIDAFLDSCR
jgi:pimeloyl-ACP methyl ester carboxylesterase